MTTAQFSDFFEALDAASRIAFNSETGSLAEAEALDGVLYAIEEARLKMQALQVGAVDLTRRH